MTADLLYYEGFEYGNDPDKLTAASSGNWSTASVDDDALYLPTGLTYGSLQVNGGCASSTTSWGSGTRSLLADFNDIDLSAKSEVWVSMLLRAPGGVSSSSECGFGIRLQRNAWGSVQNYGAGKSWNNVSSHTSKFLGNIPGGEFSTVGADVFLLVYCFKLGSAGELWINPVVDGVTVPTSGSGFSLNDSANTGLVNISEAYISFRAHEQMMDELRIGDSFLDVVPLGSSLPPQVPQLTTLYIDFGSSSYPTADAGWNNITTSAIGVNYDLIDYASHVDSHVDLSFQSGFDGINSSGSNAANGDFTAEAMKDSFYANNGTRPVIELSGLHPDQSYTLTFSASRMTGNATDPSRTTHVTAYGEAKTTAILDAANNTSVISVLSGVFPDHLGKIRLEFQEDRSSRGDWFYLGALKVESDQYACIDFGSTANLTTDYGWTNFSDATTGGPEVSLGDFYTGVDTGWTVQLTGSSAGQLTSGTTPEAPLSPDFADAAIQDGFWWSSSVTATFKFSGFDPEKDYSFTFVGARAGVSDNRTAVYTLAGDTVKSTTLNASSNTSRSATIPSIRPNLLGEFSLSITADGGNNQYTYLNAMEITTSNIGFARRHGVAPLSIADDQYVDEGQQPVKFWGMNVVAFYPSHDVADDFADHLVELGVNCVRWHHMLRRSNDWNWQKDGLSDSHSNPLLHSTISLAAYEGTATDGESREPNEIAWDRFDYMNAKLRERGINVMFSNIWLRQYRPDDVGILSVSTQDDQDWRQDIATLNTQGGMDQRKALAVFDERVELMNQEFCRDLLGRVNPYTGLRYGDDDQVIAFELSNEFSSEYTFVNPNWYDDDGMNYFQAKLQAKWESYALSVGQSSPGSIKTTSYKELRSDFLNKLDADYSERMNDFINSLGYDEVPVIFSNLWRGNRPFELFAEENDYMEQHAYVDPNIFSNVEDWLVKAGKMAVYGKPYFIGELGLREDRIEISPNVWVRQYADVDDPIRSLLPASFITYGSLHGWSGLAWFAYNHGNHSVETRPSYGNVGAAYGPHVTRETSDFGDLICDEVMLDHMLTSATIFRRGLFARSDAPITITSPDNAWSSSYHGTVNQLEAYAPGWQSKHEIRRVLGSVPSSQAAEPYMAASPAGNVLVSDTGEIRKDLTREQLTAAADQAEVFSGFLDSNAPDGLQCLQIGNTSGFATVMLVTADNLNLDESERMLLSRTYIDSSGDDLPGPSLSLQGVKEPTGEKVWKLHSRDGTQTLTYTAGELLLPVGADTWRRAELVLE
ncbi:hypothetical protein [Cerasicoccus fimbriatus]|uniref:hypothetical protein n=1 Tax=Cerasicoccus fimbriatus TaxID=3014554 RepID=UPI0022B48E0B|nr:hypothetical protein [Cerasicoccus sp. TK19100]